MIIRFLGLSLLFSLIALTQIGAQQWVLVQDRDIVITGQRDIKPDKFSTYQIDAASVSQILRSAPLESEQEISKSPAILNVGLADGKTESFRIVQYEMMEKGLAEKYPQIRTYRGVSVTNPFHTIRADWTTEGFRAVIHDDAGMMFIDPLQRNDITHRIAYYKKDYSDYREWECGVNESSVQKEKITREINFGDCQFRTYRLAVATTGEYSNYFGATSSAQSDLVLSQVVTAINRVNDVYEADITVRLLLIENTPDVFYYNPDTDPFSGSACTQLSQNQSNMTNVIGNANYDIGHVFSVGSGGCAALGVLCVTSSKAKGATGLNPPTGDPFYIDYVAHEMGHQFGGDHTFNGTAGSCNGNRVPSSAYEPGSGSTIMAYAGICGAQDLQPHSDPYFHARSLFQIANVLNAATCANFLSFNNQAPVAGSPPNYTIPISTPFVLTAIATDADNDPLTYCWEEYDLESTSSEPPSSTDTLGPLFRSYNPTISPSRYFPKIADIIQNTSTPWEVLPSVSRLMTFRMTVRDYHDGAAGCTDEDDVTVTSSSTSGPFFVTSQNIGISWPETSTQTITWNVANTTAPPVNCSNVDILLSTDGGYTYPILLSGNEINDGMATLIVPNVLTSTGRVMVKGVNTIFFDINNADITIDPPAPTFTISINPVSISGCNTGNVTTVVHIGQFMGFNKPVSLTALSLPAGAIATFNPPTINPGDTSTLTISNLIGLSGSFSPIVRGTSSVGHKDVYLYLDFLAAPSIGPSLTSPTNNANDVVITPMLDWNPVSGISQYEYQLAYDINFNEIANSGLVSTDKIQIISSLLVDQLYYWRVRSVNECGNSTWSSAFNFTTGSCFALNSTNVPIIIPSTGTPTVTSTLTNSISMTINDLNIINLMGTHSWVNDLEFSLISPLGTEILFWNQPCADDDNFNINFDDEAPNNSWPCPPTDGLTYKPDGLLSAFDGEQAAGTWTLKIHDVANQDGGSLNAWGLQVCGTISCQLIVNQTTGSGTGSLPAAINCSLPGDTVIISSQLGGQIIHIGSNPITISKNLVILAQGMNTTITGEGTRVFNINEGIQFECISMNIEAGTSLTAGAIANNGTLKLKNSTITQNSMVTGATLIQNNPGATLNVAGSCHLNQ